MADGLKYPLPPKSAPRGEWLLWAGNFAKTIASTKIYKELWPTSDPNLSNPLWVISGICWDGLDQKKKEHDPFNPFDQFFPEGKKKRRLHFRRERSRRVVSKAKELGLEIDPLLRSGENINFSFAKRNVKLGIKAQ